MKWRKNGEVRMPSCETCDNKRLPQTDSMACTVATTTVRPI